MEELKNSVAGKRCRMTDSECLIAAKGWLLQQCTQLTMEELKNSVAHKRFRMICKWLADSECFESWNRVTAV
jgi:hypothetical protein